MHGNGRKTCGRNFFELSKWLGWEFANSVNTPHIKKV